MNELGLQGSERLTGAMQERLVHHAQPRQMNGEFYRLAAAKRPVCNEGYLNFVFMPLFPGTYSYIGECVISYHIACIELLIRLAMVDKKTYRGFFNHIALGTENLPKWKNCY